jgi:hypothetical protein
VSLKICGFSVRLSDLWYYFFRQYALVPETVTGAQAAKNDEGQLQ